MLDFPATLPEGNRQRVVCIYGDKRGDNLVRMET